MERALTWARTPAGRGAVLLTLATLATGWAMAAQQNIVTNYFEDVLGLAGPQFGYITAIREVPGFLLIFLTALFFRLSLPKLTALALVVLAVGYGFYGHSHSFWTVVPWVVISSMGYHTWLQTQYALGMSLTTENRSGRILGRMSAVNNVGALLAMVVILLTFHFGWLGFRSAFVVCGLLALVAAGAIVGFPNLHNGELQARAARRAPIVLRRDYRHYYGLSLLDGARMQIFFSFGLWVLVAHFGLPVPTISAVLLISTSASIWVGPWVGRNIDLYGERRMLSVVNVLYIVALVGYALVDNVVAAVVCYLIYTLIMPLSSLGAATYLRKVAPADDIAPSLAMGVTMQHAAAIVVPVSTGFILNFVGYQVPFLIACGFACGAIVVTQRLAPERQKSARRIAEEARLAAGLAAPGAAVLAGRDERTQATWVEEPASGHD